MLKNYLSNFFFSLSVSQIRQAATDEVDSSFVVDEMKQVDSPDSGKKRLQGKQLVPKEECSRLLNEFSQVAILPNLEGLKIHRINPMACTVKFLRS
jgi:hypothetical protein